MYDIVRNTLSSDYCFLVILNSSALFRQEAYSREMGVAMVIGCRGDNRAARFGATIPMNEGGVVHFCTDSCRRRSSVQSLRCGRGL